MTLKSGTSGNAAVDVVTTVGSEQLQAGTLYVQGDAFTFVYARDYLRDGRSYDLAPSLPRSSAPFPSHGLGPFSDSAPDRWGRKIIARDLRRRRVSEAEYLLGVNDATRQGANRFYVNGLPVAGNEGVPVLADLPELLDSADAVMQNREIDDIALRRLYRATGSLGGARPKASVMNQGVLWMAKFPKPNGDDWDVIGWEAVSLQLACESGISVPDFRVLSVKDGEDRNRTILLTKRFDRRYGTRGGSLLKPEDMARIPYMSAMTALEARDGDGGDWMELAEFTKRSGGDTRELWRRAVFGAAIGNCDDHLRNHGFLRGKHSWELSPAFDMNPEPYDDSAADVHELSLFGDAEVSVDKLMGRDALALFGVDAGDANAWRRNLRRVLARATTYAGMRHIDHTSIDMMASRFEYADEQLR